MARFGWTLLHFLWQGTAIAAVYIVIRFLFGRAPPPRKRYAPGCAALIAMVLAPLSGGDLAQVRKSGTSSMDLAGEITDSLGTIVQRLQDHIDVVLAGAALSAPSPELASTPIEYQAGFTLLPGKYSMKIMARDSTSGVVATFENAFTIPNLNKEVQRIPIGSMVLGSERAWPATRPVANPLYREGQQLVPNVTRVFSSKNDMAVYPQAFEKGASAAQPLVDPCRFSKRP